MPGQSYVERQPVPALAAHVSSVWIQRIAPDAPPYRQRNVPNGAVEVLCRLGSIPRIVGPLTRPTVETLPPGTTVVGIRFHPGAAAGALGVPLSELVDLAVTADELWGAEAVALAEAIDDVASPSAALALVQRQLAERLKEAPDPLVAAAVRRLMPWQRGEVGSLTAELGVSERQLRRRLGSATGHPPKPLHRMLRFQGFLALAQLAMAQGKLLTGERIARLAADAGYADQPHLTRECQRLTGESPRAFLGQVEDHCGCGHDHAASYTPLLRSRPA